MHNNSTHRSEEAIQNIVLFPTDFICQVCGLTQPIYDDLVALPLHFPAYKSIGNLTIRAITVSTKSTDFRLFFSSIFAI